MTSTKLPIALSAAVLIGSATLVTMKESAAQKAAIEAAELSMQNRSISSLESQNKSLSLAASRAGGFQDDDSKISIVQRQVKDLESKADDRRALAIARQKAFRKTNQDDASPESESARIQKQPKLLTQVRPEYPAEMRTSGTSGEVMVDLIVDKNGVVQNAFALSSTDKAFADAAVSAVSQWTFEPGLANGHAVFTHLQIPIVFTPSADAPAPTAGTWF
jgi:TonB family protein